jgi:hypothetical protein
MLKMQLILMTTAPASCAGHFNEGTMQAVRQLLET